MLPNTFTSRLGLEQSRNTPGGPARVIKTSARGTMGHAVADKRVYVHEALHLQGKLQKAGYKQAVEKWETDSDSDESEDEDYTV